MPCYRPVKAFYGNKLSSGKREIVFSSGQAQSCLDLALPCGCCVGCRLERARQWAMRCMDEASLYVDNSFITLTFDDAHLPFNRSVDVGVFQRFMKRLRKAVGSDHMVRYFHVGEYGPLHGRPHYHALLFNLGFPDRVYLKTTDAGEKIYTSKFLQSVWSDKGVPLGYCSVGDVTFGSAAYVARYHLKKVGSVVSDNHYLDKCTGEMLAPEYVTMSRGSCVRGTGGIARGWFEKFSSDVYPADIRVIKGVDTKPCKFYDSLYERQDIGAFNNVKFRRCRSVNRSDNTESRLLVKEEVKKAQLCSLSSAKEI